MKNSIKVFIGLVIVAAIAVGVYLYYPHSPAGSQQNNMATAEQCSLVIRKPVKQQERFNGIKRFVVHTGNSGSLLIIGEVNSSEDLTDLKTLAASTCPDTKFSWDVDVIDAK